MAELKIDTGSIQKLAPLAALMITVVVGLGLWSAVNGIQADVATLDAQVAQLEEVDDRIEEVALKVAKTEADVAAVAAARDDILRTLCRILERAPEQCGVS